MMGWGGVGCAAAHAPSAPSLSINRIALAPLQPSRVPSPHPTSPHATPRPPQSRPAPSLLPAPQVRMHFRPEFINRIDEFIVFQGLRKEQIKSIVQLQVGRSCWCGWAHGWVGMMCVGGCWRVCGGGWGSGAAHGMLAGTIPWPYHLQCSCRASPPAMHLILRSSLAGVH